MNIIWAQETIDDVTETCHRLRTEPELRGKIHCSEEHPGPRTTLAVSNAGLRSQEESRKGTVCRCIKRHLSETELRELQPSYKWIPISNTTLREHELDEAGKYMPCGFANGPWKNQLMLASTARSIINFDNITFEHLNQGWN